MRPELEEIKYIEDYLLNRLNKEQKAEFEQRVKDDVVFANKVKLQRLLMKRVNRLGIKHTVARVHRRHTRRENFLFKRHPNKNFFKSVLGLSVVLLVGYLIFITDSDNSSNNVEQDSIELAILPPVKGVDVPFNSDTIIAEEGGVIHYSSGSSVIIPQNAFVDENNKVVSGKVELKFREFKDAADIFLAGIPMNFHPNGDDLVLESAAMCEINAYQNEKALKIEKGREIEIMQNSYTSSNTFNLYQLDKKTGKWTKKGKDVPVEFMNEPITEKQALQFIKPISSLEKPIKPKKITDFNYSLTINFLESEFPELSVYKNVEFGVDPDDKTYNPANANIRWEDVKLDKGSKDGSYKLTFTRGSRQLNIIVYPAFSGVNFDNAMKIYNKKFEKYNQLKEERLQKEKDALILARLKQDSINDLLRKQDSINKIIEARNAEIDLYNKRLNSPEAIALRNKQNELMRSWLIEDKVRTKLLKIFSDEILDLKNSKYIEKLHKELTQAKTLFRKRSFMLKWTSSKDIRNQLMNIPYQMDTLISQKEFIESSWKKLDNRFKEEYMEQGVYRSFRIDNFGIWNCDQPTKKPEGMMVIAEFTLNNTNLPLQKVNLVNKDIRTIYTISNSEFSKFKYNPGASNTIWAIVEGSKLVYYNNLNSIPLNTNGKAFTFEMKEVKEELKNFNQVKEIINSL